MIERREMEAAEAMVITDDEYDDYSSLNKSRKQNIFNEYGYATLSEFEDDDLILSSVRFHAGCSTPFMAEIKFRGEVEEVEFDPFSGYVLAMEE